jgi:hypothetical protein
VWKSRERTGNVYENKGTYHLELECRRKQKDLMLIAAIWERRSKTVFTVTMEFGSATEGQEPRTSKTTCRPASWSHTARRPKALGRRAEVAQPPLNDDSVF